MEIASTKIGSTYHVWRIIYCSPGATGQIREDGDDVYLDIQSDHICHKSVVINSGDCWYVYTFFPVYSTESKNKQEYFAKSEYPLREAFALHGLAIALSQELVKTQKLVPELQQKIGNVLKSILARHPQQPGASVARVANSKNSEVSGPGNDICNALHDIANLLEIELPADQYLQRWQPPNQRQALKA